MSIIYEAVVCSLKTVEDLMEYATVYGIQDLPMVQRRLQQLRHEAVSNDFELALE